jgi:glycosyltransferase involved in cell wall biosynthesis
VAGKIHVLYNGIDDVPFDLIGDVDIAAARHEFGLEGATVVGVFGRLAEWKGQHVALEALRLLPGVHLLIVGDALFGEDRYAASLREQARRSGVAGRVHFAGFRRDIPLLMRAVDIVAHTSIAPEPFGRVIVEGMLARRPVIATRGGGVDEIVEPGETGILVTPGDAAELAEAIGGLAAGPDIRRRLAEAGRDAAVRRFSQAAMLHGMRAHIDGVLAA